MMIQMQLVEITIDCPVPRVIAVFAVLNLYRVFCPHIQDPIGVLLKMKSALRTGIDFVHLMYDVEQILNEATLFGILLICNIKLIARLLEFVKLSLQFLVAGVVRHALVREDVVEVAGPVNVGL